MRQSGTSPARREVEQARQQLAPGEVAGGTEQHDHVRSQGRHERGADVARFGLHGHGQPPSRSQRSLAPNLWRWCCREVSVDRAVGERTTETTLRGADHCVERQGPADDLQGDRRELTTVRPGVGPELQERLVHVDWARSAIIPFTCRSTPGCRAHAAAGRRRSVTHGWPRSGGWRCWRRRRGPGRGSTSAAGIAPVCRRNRFSAPMTTGPKPQRQQA